MRTNTKILIGCFIALFSCFLMISFVKIELTLKQQENHLSIDSKTISKSVAELTSRENLDVTDKLLPTINLVLVLLVLGIGLLLRVLTKSLENPLAKIYTLVLKHRNKLAHEDSDISSLLTVKEADVLRLLEEIQLKSEDLHLQQTTKLDEAYFKCNMLLDHNQATFFVNKSGFIQYQNNQASTLLKKLCEDGNISIPSKPKYSLSDFIHDSELASDLVKSPQKLPFQMNVQVTNDTIDLNAAAVHDVNGEYIGAMITWEMIAKKLENQIVLNRSAAISHSSPICTLTANLDGKIDFINQASIEKFEEIKSFLPVKIKDILGSSIDIFHANPKHVNTIVGDPENLPYESQILLGGETLALKLSAMYDEFNHYSGVLLHWNIITKELESKNRQLQKLLEDAKQASVAKSNFLANMTHELRTPLNGVIGFTDLLLEDDINSEQRDSLEVIKNCSDSLLDLINDILDLNRIVADQMVLEYKPMNLEDIIYSCNHDVREKIGDKGLNLLVSMDSLDSQVIFDTFRLKQVLSNLLSNAVKFTDSGEIITMVEVLFESDTLVKTRISVKDTGVGIARESYSKILERFEQADGSVTRKFGGIGLGLNICKRILEMMGSELTFESTVNQGSTFSFVLELQKNPETIIGKSISDKKDKTKGIKLLVADTSTLSLEITSNLCKSLGYSIFEANDSSSAQSILENENIDIVLVEFSEKSLYQEIRHLKTNAKLIAMTTDVRQNIVAKIQLEGFYEFIAKPIRRNVLSHTLVKVLHQSIEDLDLNPSKSIEETTVLDILIAEDNPINQKMIQKILMRMGHKITLVDNGEKAIIETSSQEFDIILMDIHMPVVDGTVAARQIIANGCNTPIIAIISSGSPDDKRLCYASGMIDYISKPFVRQDIYNVLKKYTDEKLKLSYTDVPKILIAEDNEAMLKTISSVLLEFLPLSIVKTASDGIEASAILANFSPNILIVDLLMPNMSGQDLMHHMNSQEKYEDLHIIVISSLSESDPQVLEVKEMRDVHFISKPFKLDQLINTVNKCIS